MGSSFAVILAGKNDHPTLGYMGRVGWSKLGVVATSRFLFLLLIQKYWCYALETSCVCYNSKNHQNRIFLVAKIGKSAYFQQNLVKSGFFVTMTSFAIVTSNEGLLALF